MLNPKVTLKVLVIKEFFRLNMIGVTPYTCLILTKSLRKLDYNYEAIYELRDKYLETLRLKYKDNFGWTVFVENPPNHERLQNLLDFIKSEGL